MFDEKKDEVKRKHDRLDQKILEAEEAKDRGLDKTGEQLKELKAERSHKNEETRRASNEDYIRERNRRRENRTKLEKVVDAFTGEL